MDSLFLGYAIKEDRRRVGITQAQLQREITDLAMERDNNYSDEEKVSFYNRKGASARHKKKIIYSNVPSKLISNIERGVARSVSTEEIELISEVLKVPPGKYFDLEVNPVNLINSFEEVSTDSFPNFERCIEFEPDNRKAGVSILSFFSEIVESEFSGQSVKVGIIQSGNVVTLRVETPEGKLLKEVEKALNQYGLAVMGKAPIDSVSNNPQVIQDLKMRLEVTKLELKLGKEAAIERSKQYEDRIGNLEGQLFRLQGIIGESLSHNSSLVDVIKGLSEEDKSSKSLLKAISVIEKLTLKSHSGLSEKELKDSLEIIREKSPSLFKRVVDNFDAIPASIGANFSTEWIQSIISSLPK